MSDKKAAGHPDGASVCSGLAASAPSWLTSSLALIRVLAVVMVMRQPSALSAGPQTGRPRGLPVAKESSAGMFTQHCVCLALLCFPPEMNAVITYHISLSYMIDYAAFLELACAVYLVSCSKQALYQVHLNCLYDHADSLCLTSAGPAQ